MFFLGYLHHELLRRKGRTFLTLLGLGLGVALVIAISALSRGLDRAQRSALDPLASIGTDLTVTRASQEDAGPGGFRDVFTANRSVLTDLSTLGKAGDHFVHDFFLPGNQLTFPQRQARQISSLPSVAAVSEGLILLAVHQEGTVPKIVARFRTGGQRIQINRQIKPLTPAELAKAQTCFAKAGVAAPAQPGGGQPGFGSGQRGNPGAFEAARTCLPDRFQRFRATFTTPRQTLQQILDPPQTNIESEPYTIGGVDQTQPAIGLVTPAQVTRGRYFERADGREALVATGYASAHGLEVGSTIDLNGTTFRVVGLVRPPLGGQTADVYLPLAQLQRVAGQKGLANVVLVRAEKSSAVGGVQRAIERSLQGAQVASSKQVADRITGSLVDAASLSRKLGLWLSVVAAAAAFLFAGLLTLSSVGKRVRELGTLKALGWTQRLVVRQVVGESLAQGVAGGLLGIGLGIGAAAAVDAFGPTLTASSTTGGGGGIFGLGDAAARTASSTIALTAPLSVSLVLIGFALALLGGLLAGGAGALRAARLRPADALRQVE